MAIAQTRPVTDTAHRTISRITKEFSVSLIFQYHTRAAQRCSARRGRRTRTENNTLLLLPECELSSRDQDHTLIIDIVIRC